MFPFRKIYSFYGVFVYVFHLFLFLFLFLSLFFNPVFCIAILLLSFCIFLRLPKVYNKEYLFESVCFCFFL